MSPGVSQSLRSALFVALGQSAPALADPGLGGGGLGGGGLGGGGPEVGWRPGSDRPGPSTCSPEIPQPPCTDPGVDATSCHADGDCIDGEYGECVQAIGMIGNYCKCEYACSTNADCERGERCVCADALRGHFEHSACVPAECASGDDCESGVCALSLFFNGCSHEAVFACRGAADECASDADCAGRSCAYDDGAWACRTITCIVGRPLVIDGAPRVAAASPGGAWLIALAAARELPGEDEALGAYWAEVAALEHASIASFARFTLELLALGAPPELLADTQRAALDEVAHAQLAWSLASAYLGRPIGPGPLGVDGVAPGRTMAEVVASLVREGCVGETLGAAEAGRIAELAAPTSLRAALAAVADDEQRHAALAWRTLQWLIAQGGDSVRTVALEAAAAAREEWLRAPATGQGPLGPGERAELRRRTFDAVIGPVLQAVLARATA